MDEDIFTLKARRCKRCGGILISAKAIEDGMGDCCRRKTEYEIAKAEERKNQLNFFNMEDKENG